MTRKPMTPEDVDFALVDAYNRGDLDAAVDLHEDNVVTWALPHEGGHVQRGRDQIRKGFANGLFLIKGKMQLRVRHMTQNDDLALLRSSWSVSGTLPDGSPVELAHAGIEVVRRQADGSWKFAIDHPWGCNPIAFDRFSTPPMSGEVQK